MKTFFTTTASRRAQFAEELLTHAQRLGGAQATVRDLVERGYDDVRASHLRFADFSGVAQ